VDAMPNSQAGRLLLSDQLLRSGTLPALHYGEAQAAMSKKEFIYKLRNALKELRESHACPRINLKAAIHPASADAEVCRKECSALVAIFQASVKTAESKK
jgi:four helix bundle protein